MDLDKLQFKACVRSGWQAIDLGFLMARSWWLPLFMVGALPATLLLIPLLLVFWESPHWAGVIVWWLKPFWERLPLYLASRKIFSEAPPEWGIIQQVRSLYLKDWLPWLLWRRFSFNRAFDAPVTVLEELKAKPRSQRLRVLHGKHTDMALANQLVCFCCELILAAGLFTCLLFFIPDSLDPGVYDSLESLTLAGVWIYTLCYFSAMILVMPFHSMAGFALYLNRRIDLEAWDIEITFRSLSQRKKQAGSRLIASILIPLMISLSVIFQSTPTLAATDHNNESARELISEVLKGEDFGREETVEKWRFINWVEENQDRIPEWLIDFIEWMEANFKFDDATEETLQTTAFWLKVLLVVIFICLLVYLFYRFRGPLKKLGSSRQPEAAPDIMFGLDVRPESLPDDVPVQVMNLWQAEQPREALGLLYRATLSRLIAQHALRFKSSHTESECAALVQAYGIQSLSYYFFQLTRIWRRLAYGHELPQVNELKALCESWSKEMAHDPQ
ncbi:MAG: hypothetical protein OEY09_18515 [Gammaproteobacteria bacterium]|nr:hypothetical protein [Gammaproteobacteria bacterium]